MEDRERKKQIFEDILRQSQSGHELALLLRTVEDQYDIKAGEFLYYIQSGEINEN
jgi:hypothetical protein